MTSEKEWTEVRRRDRGEQSPRPACPGEQTGFIRRPKWETDHVYDRRPDLVGWCEEINRCKFAGSVRRYEEEPFQNRSRGRPSSGSKEEVPWVSWDKSVHRIIGRRFETGRYNDWCVTGR